MCLVVRLSPLTFVCYLCCFEVHVVFLAGWLVVVAVCWFWCLGLCCWVLLFCCFALIVFVELVSPVGDFVWLICFGSLCLIRWFGCCCLCFMFVACAWFSFAFVADCVF